MSPAIDAVPVRQASKVTVSSVETLTSVATDSRAIRAPNASTFRPASGVRPVLVAIVVTLCLELATIRYAHFDKSALTLMSV